MSRRAFAWAGLVLALLVGCGEDEKPRLHPSAWAEPRAAWLLEPPEIGVGQVTTLELAVATPPGFSPRPYAPPQPPAGLWLLDAETLPVEKQADRWLYRTRLRLRAEQTGELTWPESELSIDAPDGTKTTLTLPAHPITVLSILPDYPDRMTPFGVREPGGAAEPGPVWVPAAAGALLSLAVVGLVALARRRRQAAARAAREPAPEPGPPPWTRARDELASAHDALAGDPLAAAHALSIGLRHYVDRRFGAHTAGATGEELAEREPPFAGRSRWPALLAILAELDRRRFRPDAGAALATRLPELLEAAGTFVEDSVPPEARS